MKWLPFALFRLPKGVFPSPEGSQLLKAGRQALNENNFDRATEIYGQMPTEDKNTKLVKGFFDHIDNVRKTHDYTKELNERMRGKSK